MMNQPVSLSPSDSKGVKTSPKLNVEFFHIYTDETINERHTRGLEYLKAIEKTWSFPYERVVLIDNYNPVQPTLTAENVLKYLNDQNMPAHYWAYEKDLVPHAEKLLSALTSSKLKRNYESYVEKNNKYPCSLLVATWYLTRLGRLEYANIIKPTASVKSSYSPAERLMNILPQDYKGVEGRARELIHKSIFSEDVDRIQDLFYPTDSTYRLDLF